MTYVMKYMMYVLHSLACLKTHADVWEGVLRLTTLQILDRNGPMINLDAERF